MKRLITESDYKELMLLNRLMLYDKSKNHIFYIDGFGIEVVNRKTKLFKRDVEDYYVTNLTVMTYSKYGKKVVKVTESTNQEWIEEFISEYIIYSSPTKMRKDWLELETQLNAFNLLKTEK